MIKDMVKLKKSFIFVIILGVLVFFIATITYMNKGHHHDNIFEYDEYGDGDYDEEKRRHIPKWNYTRENIGLFIHRKVVTKKPPPTPFVPEIFINEVKRFRFDISMPFLKVEDNFFRYLEQKDIRCKQDRRLGHQHDGGWNVCFSPPFGLKKPCLVYSFGIGDDWNFDDAVSKIYGCSVLSFDPSLEKLKNHNRSNLIRFKKVGIGARNGVNKKGWQIKTLAQHIIDEGHEKTVIDYVKIDVEYMEWRILQNILQDQSLRRVKQIGFELHTREFFSRFKNPRIESHSTVKDFVYMANILKELVRKKNFKKFNYRKNPFGEYDAPYSKTKRSCCYELHYMNMNFATPNYTTPERKSFPNN